MIDSVTIIACAILASLAIFQVALIAGAPLGKYAWGGAHTVLPARLRVGSVISIILYMLFAVIILSKVEVISGLINPVIADVGMWILVAYFTLGVLMNAISRSKPERNLMTPIALLLAVASTFIALK